MFFLFILSSLMMIFYFFKPLDIKQQLFVDIPLFEIRDFSLYELNQEKIKTFMSGDVATRYADRYTVKSMDFTDNSKTYIANMKADSGLYEGDIITLIGKVSYFREDGLTFDSQEVVYNKKTSVAKTQSEYVAYMGDNKITGVSLEYNSLLNKIESKQVVAKYILDEEQL
ncbi:LPS export ABC transporter periplasmic protein LptC [Sulfurimonas aquatica]|uniref:LPS export ABC transporter periplasmic protein LptC n=1 Tax=Sulfurimonas aquatica TaxID=2672570 RepID=UPI002101EB14|nr:LPS export ABC transporter periplasmic protein LptC [Sulfurimonas aquatica]